MQEGAVVEEGTHEELMRRGAEGAYHSLVALQAAATTKELVATAKMVDIIRVDEELARVAVAEAVARGASQQGGAGSADTARDRSNRLVSMSAGVVVPDKPAPASYKEAVASKLGEEVAQIETEDLVRAALDSYV